MLVMKKIIKLYKFFNNHHMDLEKMFTTAIKRDNTVMSIFQNNMTSQQFEFA